MKTKKDCSKCYVEVKKYTPIRGIIWIIGIQFMLCIPILNLIILTDIHKKDMKLSKNELYKEMRKGFWEDTFYNYEKVKVNEG